MLNQIELEVEGKVLEGIAKSLLVIEIVEEWKRFHTVMLARINLKVIVETCCLHLRITTKMKKSWRSTRNSGANLQIDWYWVQYALNSINSGGNLCLKLLCSCIPKWSSLVKSGSMHIGWSINCVGRMSIWAFFRWISHYSWRCCLCHYSLSQKAEQKAYEWLFTSKSSEELRTNKGLLWSFILVWHQENNVVSSSWTGLNTKTSLEYERWIHLECSWFLQFWFPVLQACDKCNFLFGDQSAKYFDRSHRVAMWKWCSKVGYQYNNYKLTGRMWMPRSLALSSLTFFCPVICDLKEVLSILTRSLFLYNTGHSL